MTIDSHQHFWHYEPIKHQWINEKMSIIRRDFLPEDLHPVLQKNNVDACVVVQADQTEAETFFLLDLAKKNDFIKGVVGWVDLRADDIEEKLFNFSSESFLKGFRHVLQDEDPSFMLQTGRKVDTERYKQTNL